MSSSNLYSQQFYSDQNSIMTAQIRYQYTLKLAMVFHSCMHREFRTTTQLQVYMLDLTMIGNIPPKRKKIIHGYLELEQISVISSFFRHGSLIRVGYITDVARLIIIVHNTRFFET
jgi:hypothetical protein